MKNKLLTILSFTALILVLAVFSSCEKPVDLVTEDALAGGLINISSTSVPYKSGVTTDIPIDIDIPAGAAISSIEIYSTFNRLADGESSSEVLLKTLPVSGSTLSTTVNYSELAAGLTVGGSALPSDASGLSIGDNWVLRYVIKMGDGRILQCADITAITIANPYAGNYTREGVLVHPSAGVLPYGPEEITLATVDGSTVQTICGYWENPNYSLTIKVNADLSVVCGGDVGGSEVTNIPGSVNEYDAATKTFTLHYTYNGRTFAETVTAIE